MTRGPRGGRGGNASRRLVEPRERADLQIGCRLLRLTKLLGHALEPRGIVGHWQQACHDDAGVSEGPGLNLLPDAVQAVEERLLPSRVRARRVERTEVT